MNALAEPLPDRPPPSNADCLRQLTRKDFQTDLEIRWCPGCGDYAILTQVQKVLASLGKPRERCVFVSGIGCSSRFPYYVNTYGFHGIHGRAPAIATGVKCANPELSVWVVTGDGDGLSIGTNHLIHCLRRNVDIKVLLFNNRIYGLTKGQYSPTSEFGKRTKSSPLGTIEQPIRPIQTALAAEATFVARTIYADPNHLLRTVEAAARHRGAAFVEILQTCRVFNDDAFDAVSDRATAAESRLLLEHGQPIRFGADGRKGLVVRQMEPVVVDVEADGIREEELLVHNARSDSAALASLLAELEPPKFPTALGVFRAIERPTYDHLLTEQIREAVQRRGAGDLQALLNSGTTWQVD
ncbi:MAG: 2-oxoacid:ferredoxin oxidoreductase subunit beta [Verrucomicrobia bacterium]|nr:2-oxoacid:ferredoxin oxidoreductase subunit beta [Verrucomicrobiota bacterium]